MNNGGGITTPIYDFNFDLHPFFDFDSSSSLLPTRVGGWIDESYRLIFDA
jgi:hypothetical protein